jgi:hypothetical protein
VPDFDDRYRTVANPVQMLEELDHWSPKHKIISVQFGARSVFRTDLDLLGEAGCRVKDRLSAADLQGFDPAEVQPLHGF